MCVLNSLVEAEVCPRTHHVYEFSCSLLAAHLTVLDELKLSLYQVFTLDPAAMPPPPPAFASQLDRDDLKLQPQQNFWPQTHI